jgi:uracil permease
MFGVCPNTTYGESVGCVAITRNASVVTITTTAVMCILLSFIAPITSLLMTIPSCVMGGVCLTLYGFIAVSGLKMFKGLDLNDNKNLFVVSAILIAGIGSLTIQIPSVIDANGTVSKAITITGIATALILGIITNAVLTALEKSKLGKAPESSENEDTAETTESVEE